MVVLICISLMTDDVKYRFGQKVLLGFSRKMAQKNPNENFGQPSSFSYAYCHLVILEILF